MRFLFPLLPVSFLIPMQAAFAQASVSAPWDIKETIVALSEQTARLKPVLDQLTPDEWVPKGAPVAYVAQWRSAQRELSDVDQASAVLQKQPEKLSAALNVYFRIQTLEARLTSLVDGVRTYQNPAVGDLIVGIVGENSGNRDKLRQYIADLADQKEQEFAIADKEAQRCRVQLNRQSGPAKPAAPRPVKPQLPNPAGVK
jgi:hypothetical protein